MRDRLMGERTKIGERGDCCVVNTVNFNPSFNAEINSTNRYTLFINLSFTLRFLI